MKLCRASRMLGTAFLCLSFTCVESSTAYPQPNQQATMAAYGAEVILAPSMEAARDMLLDMKNKGLGHCLDQYNNEDNTDSHYCSTGESKMRQRRIIRSPQHIQRQKPTPDAPSPHQTPGPEVWRQTNGRVTHLVSSMGTFGTIMGAGRYLKQQNPGVQVVGLQPSEAVQIPGIRRWR